MVGGMYISLLHGTWDFARLTLGYCTASHQRHQRANTRTAPSYTFVSGSLYNEALLEATSIRGLALSFANLLARQLLPRLHGVRIQHVLEREQERRRDDALRDLRSNTCATSVPHNTK